MSSTSSGGSSGSSSSTSGSRSKHSNTYMLWLSKNQRIAAKSHCKMHTIQVKKRADFLAHASCRPGVFAGWLIQQIRARLVMSDAEDADELRNTGLTLWASMRDGLKEVSGLKEVQLLAKCLAAWLCVVGVGLCCVFVGRGGVGMPSWRICWPSGQVSCC